MDDQLSPLPDIEPLTILELKSDLDIACKAAHNAAIDAAIATVNATTLEGPQYMVEAARDLLNALAKEMEGLKL